MNFNAYPLLYSRSRGKDYRWMLVPPFVTQNDLLLLNKIYDSFDNHKESAAIEKSGVPVIFYLRLSESSVIAQCEKTGFKDKEGRAIYSLQGLAVHQTEGRDFWYSLPFLIIRSKKYIDSWQYISFNVADVVSKSESKSREIRLSDLERGLTKVIKGIPGNKSLPLESEQIQLPYDKNGLIELLGYLMSPRVSALNFAFGFSNDILSRVSDFKIFAPIKTPSKGNEQYSQIKQENVELEKSKAIFENRDLRPRKEDSNARIEFCDIHLTSCMVGDFLGLLGSKRLCLEAYVDSDSISKAIVSIPMSYPANQIEILKRGPTLEAQRALENLRAQLITKGWKEINMQKENWWEGRFQR